MKNNKINIQEVINSADENWKKLEEGLDNSNLSKSEAESLLTQLEEVEMEAYKAKLGIAIHVYAETDEQLSSKDFLIKMLSILPKEVPVEFLPTLIEYVLEHWVAMNRKMAA